MPSIKTAGWPVMFTPENVLLMLADLKWETRRLASSPLAKREPGELLWVRERTMVEGVRRGPRGEAVSLSYAASPLTMISLPIPPRLNRSAIVPGKYLSMGCFREASRLTLRVTAKRLQRLQDITEEDACAEGMPEPYLGDADPPWEEQAIMVSRRRQYRNLWNSLHDKPGQRWPDNPEVVALTFHVIRGNIDKIAKGA